VETVKQNLRRILNENPDRRILLLLDEADHFLTWDARQGLFPIITELKSLMDESNRRFKVIFAGLHNVRRFSTIPNQPLAHFGTPITVGPLEPRYARELIRRPLEAIGIRISDESVVLKILAHTNFLPSLIQLFCQQLVTDIRSRRHVAPPYELTPNDVDIAFRNTNLRRAMRDRFEWTLDLDPHYSVIARSMIVDQFEPVDGFSRPYTLSEMRGGAEVYWQAGFGHLTSREFQDYADELVELGALASDGNGLYRLRSPNVVRLLGNKEDIETRLLEAENDSGADSATGHDLIPAIHLALSTQPLTHSPLSLQQTKELGRGSSGVTLIVGSVLTGIGSIDDAVRSLAAPSDLDPCDYHELLLASSSGESFDLAFKKCLRGVDPEDSVLMHLDLRGSPEDLADLARVAIQAAAQSGKVSPRWCRVVLVLDSDGIRHWARISKSQRQDLESKLSVVRLSAWSEAAVGRWLSDNEVPHNAAGIRAVMEATRGYHLLLERVRARYVDTGNESLESVARQLELELQDRESDLFKEISEIVNLRDESLVEKVYSQICSLVGEREQGEWDDISVLLAESGIASRERLEDIMTHLILASLVTSNDGIPGRFKIEAMPREILGY
jgi:hypothetical protein